MLSIYYTPPYTIYDAYHTYIWFDLYPVNLCTIWHVNQWIQSTDSILYRQNVPTSILEVHDILWFTYIYTYLWTHKSWTEFIRVQQLKNISSKLNTQSNIYTHFANSIWRQQGSQNIDIKILRTFWVSIASHFVWHTVPDYSVLGCVAKL